MPIPDPVDPDAIAQVGAAIAAFVAAALFAAKRVIKAFGEARSDHAGASAHVEVIDQLRQELVRMAVQNTKLAECLNSLQLEVINLRGENADLHTTVRHLHSEVRRLRQAGAASGFGELGKS